MGSEPEKYTVSRYVCASGSEGGRKFTAGEKVLLRKSDIDNRSSSAARVLFALNPQGPFVIGKSKLCETPTFRPDVTEKKNDVSSKSFATSKNQIAKEDQRRGTCVIKIWEDAGFHSAFNCQTFAAEKSKEWGGDYQCQRCTIYCCCKYLVQRVLKDEMKATCEHQQGTWEASR